MPIFLSGFYFHKLEYNLPFNNRLFHGDWEDWFWDYYVLTHADLDLSLLIFSLRIFWFIRKRRR